MARSYDLVIVGLGPAGLTAARLASRELGLRVAAVDRGRIGGTNVWSGSIPSKALPSSTVHIELVYLITIYQRRQLTINASTELTKTVRLW